MSFARVIPGPRSLLLDVDVLTASISAMTPAMTLNKQTRAFARQTG